MKHLEQYEEQIRQAHSWISFDPEKRAKQIVNDYSNQLESDLLVLTELNASEEWISKYKELYIKKFLIWISAKSRCMSSAITGPANFPVKKAEKANEMEHRRMGEFIQWREKALSSSQNYQANKDKKEAIAANAKPNETLNYDGFKVIINYEIDRIQIQHNSKPDQYTIEKLKRHAFKWSPRYSVWQRQLTRNGVIAAELVLNVEDLKRFV